MSHHAGSQHPTLDPAVRRQTKPAEKGRSHRRAKHFQIFSQNCRSKVALWAIVTAAGEMVWWLYGKDELTNRNVECMLGIAQNVFMDAKANAEVLAELRAGSRQPT